MATIALLGVAALRIGDANLAAAERARLDARVSLVQDLAPKAAVSQTGSDLDNMASLAGFVPGDAAVNAGALVRLEQSAPGDSPVQSTLRSAADGAVLASRPEGDEVPVRELASAWAEAVAGRHGVSPVFIHEGAVVTAKVIPVGGDRPWAVAVVVNRSRDSMLQGFHERLGSLNGEAGGMELVDGAGVAGYSWDPAHVGSVVVPPAELAALPPAGARVWTTVHDGAEVTRVGAAISTGYTLVFEQETDLLYGDLRAAQRQRDATLLFVLVGTLAGLVLFQWARHRAAQRARRRVHALLENGQDLILVAGPGGRLTFVSPAIDALLGHPARAWEGRPVAELCHPDDRGRVQRLVEEPSADVLLNVRLAHGDGGWRWFDVEANDRRAQAELGGVLLTGHEVGARKAFEDDLSYRATHDHLTGLANREQLSDRLAARAGGAGPGAAAPFAVLYVDLDGFKPINDRRGHDAGDHVLRTVAERLEAAVGPRGFACRFGGDEFGVLLDGVDEEGAVAVATRIRDAVRLPVSFGPELVHVDASIGVAIGEPGLANPEQLVRRADQAMYEAKRAGRGRVAVEDRSVPSADRPTDPPPGPTPAPASPGGRPARAGGPGPASSDRRPPSATAVARSDHRPAAPRPSPVRRLLAGAPLLAAAAIVVGVGTIGYAQAATARQAAERQRAAEMARLTSRAAEYYSRQLDTGRVIALTSSLPWTFDGSATDQAITRAVGDTFLVGREGVAALVTLDGRVLASSPPGGPLGITPAHGAWRSAAAGRPSFEPFVEVDGRTRSHLIFPLVRDGRTVALFTAGTLATEGPVQQLTAQLGSIGGGSGGLSLIDGRGVALCSWDPALLGRQLADPAAVADAVAGRAPSPSAPTVVVAAPLESMSSPEPVFLAYVAPAEDLYRDLRTGQGVRDASLAILVLTGVTGLALFNQLRERTVRRDERRLDALLRHSHDIVMVAGDGQRATFVSSALHHLLGHEPGRWLGAPLWDLAHPDDRARLEEAVGVPPGHRLTVTDVRLLDHEGRPHWFDVDAVGLHDHAEVAGALLCCHEVSERKAYEDQLAHRAAHDGLTGLPNRATLSALLERLATDEPTGTFAVLFIDLDHFKPVNDALGHDAGDRVLRTIADRLVTCVRAGRDEQGPDVVFRLGGDEFAVLLGDVDEALARAASERILDAIAEPILVAGSTVQLSATIGISVSRPDRDHPEQAVRAADHAMYQAKRAGRGRYHIGQT